jgi:hypothetical protein
MRVSKYLQLMTDQDEAESNNFLLVDRQRELWGLSQFIITPKVPKHFHDSLTGVGYMNWVSVLSAVLRLAFGGCAARVGC